MATSREVLEFVIKADGSSAGSVFGKLGTQAEQTGKKLESGLSSSLKGVGTFLGNNLPGLALAGGAAIAAFGFSSAKSFADMALEAGKLADETGLTTQQAGRFIEVAKDIGISGDAVESAFGKLNKTIGASPEKFAKLGITATDTQGRILQAIDAINGIQDPAQKAALAAQLFGKGWQNISELITEGSTQIKSSLAAVADVKAVTPDDVAQARNYRASMDELHDSIEEVGLTLGRDLVPGIAAAASGLAKLINSGPVKQALDIIGAGADAAGESLSNLGDLFGSTVPKTDEAKKAAQDYSDVLATLSDAAVGANGSIQDYLNKVQFAGGKDASAQAKKSFEEQAVAAGQYARGLDYAAQATALYSQEQEKLKSAGKDSKDDAQVQADAYKALADGAKNAAGWVKALNDAEQAQFDTTRELLGLEIDVPKKLEDVATAAKDAGTAFDDANKKRGKSAELNQKASDSYRDLKDKILTAADALQKQADTQDKAKGKIDNAYESTLHFAAGLIQSAGSSKVAQKAAADFVSQLDEINPTTRAQVVADVNEGKLPEALALLRAADGTRTATLNVRVTGNVQDVYQITSAIGSASGVHVSTTRFRAAGGPVTGGAAYIVGERGPEVFVPGSSGTIIPNGGRSGGSVVVNIGTVVANDPASLVTALERYVQAGGKGRLQKLVAA